MRVACFFVILSVFFIMPVYADGTHPHGIKLDGTIGNAGKIELPGPDYAIKPEYGKQAGSNLFHSFQQLNIHKGESATFSGPDSVKNIISRVTGGLASWIDGKLASTIPNADMYFLNPFGIMFGSNASLDLKGSFHVSTADYLRLGDSERFYAVPQQNEVLSVAAPKVFGFLSEKPAKISVEGATLQVSYRETLSLIGMDIEISKSTLKAPGGSISLLGKENVSLSDSSLIDVSGTGSGSVFIRGGQFSAKNSSVRANTSAWDGGVIKIQADNISFTDGASVISNTYGKGRGGDVTLKAEESVSFAGESSTAQVSKVEVASTGKEEGAGDAGKLTVDAKNISFTGGAYVNSTTYGKGKGGEISLKASETVSFSGESSKAAVSRIAIDTYSKEEGAGDAGKLLIDAQSISFTKGSYINSTTYGKGKGGEVVLKASESVSFAGENSNGGTSGIAINTKYEEAGEGAGDAGKLSIEAKNISFTGGTGISSDTYGKGKGGEISLKASESVSFAGENSEGGVSGIGIGTTDTENDAGDAGRLLIDAQNISFTDGAVINSTTYGKGRGGDVTLKAEESVSFAGESITAQVSKIEVASTGKDEGAGDAGKLTVDAKNISFTGGTYINSGAYGKGKGGEVNLRASESVSFSGENSKAEASRILVNTQDKEEGAGDAGKLTVDAKNISFSGGTGIGSITYGKGKGGEISLKASESVSFAGEDSNADVSRIIFSTLDKEEGAGDAGKLIIDAQNISFSNGAQIYSDTDGKGKGGEISLKASESVSLSGENSKAEVSLISLDTQYEEKGAGDAGKLTIDAPNIFFSNGAAIYSNSTGKGKGGEVTLKASESVSFSGENSKAKSSFIAINATDTGNAGQLTVEAKNIYFRDGAIIASNTTGKGKGGEFILKASESVFFTGENSGKTSDVLHNSAVQIATIGDGDAGKLTIDAKNISFADGACINSNTEGKGKGGEIILKASESVSFSGEDSNAEDSRILVNTQDKEEGAGDAGTLTIEAKDISFTKGAYINSNTTGTGKGGEVSLKAYESVSFSGEDSNANVSRILVNTRDKEEGAGDAGNLTIDAGNISFTDGSGISGSTNGRGKGGEISLKASESVSFSGENSKAEASRISVNTDYEKEGAGDAGKLTIDAKNISFAGGAYITSTTYSNGKGGEVNLKASEAVSFSGENSRSAIQIATFSDGDAGKLTVEAKDISFTKGAGIDSNTKSKGKGGEVALKASESVSFSGEYSKTEVSFIGINTTDTGNAGQLTVEAKNIYFRDGAIIAANTVGKGKGGEVTLKAAESVSFSGENSNADRNSMIQIGTTGDGDAGKLTVEAKNISFAGGTVIDSDATGKGGGGEISLKASESVSFSGESSKAEGSRIFINTRYKEEGAGDAGKLNIEAKSISFTKGARIYSNTFGKGNGGEITLKASESVLFTGESSKAEVSGIGVNAQYTGEDAGKLTIDAKNIYFTDGAWIDSSAYGKGKGGEVSLKASESASFSGENSKAEVSGIGIATSDIEEGAGDAGKLNIEAENISFTGGAGINSIASGKGKGGEISLKAAESVSFSGENSKAEASRISMDTQYEEEGAGDAGKLTVGAKNIYFTDGAYINSGTFGKGKGGEVNLKAAESVSFSGENSKADRNSMVQIVTDSDGDAGALTIDAKNISFIGGANINARTFGKGNGGEIKLKALESVSFSGENSNSEASFIQIAGSDGDAGKLMVEAKNIFFTDGAAIDSSTYGKGKGGEVALKASESILFSGESSKAEVSGIEIATSDIEEGAGDAGKLTIEAKDISFSGGAGINSNTTGRGKGGEVTLKADESVFFTGENSKGIVSRILIGTFSEEEGAGEAGKLTIDAGNISFTDGSGIYSGTEGRGKGGEISLKAAESVSFSGENSNTGVSGIDIGTVSDKEGAGEAGTLTIYAKNISFTGGAGITSNTQGKGKGGEVALKASESISFSGENSLHSSSEIQIATAEEATGDAGKLMLEAKNISFTDGAWINSSTYGKGNGGEIILKASESVSFAGENSDAKSRSAIQIVTMYDKEGAGDAGKLTIDAKNISFADGAFTNSGTFGKGKGREITLNAAETITLSGVSSKGDSSVVCAGSSSTSENSGAGGKISVSAQKLQLSDGGAITTTSFGGGQAGDIALNVGGLEMSSGASVSSDATLSGGGRITVNAKDKVHLTDSSITTNVVQGTGRGGDITIGNPDTGTGSQFVILNHSNIRANAYGQGDGGAVFIVTDNFLKSADSLLTATSARGNQGTVKIESPDLDISGAMTVLPQNYSDASRFMVTPCHARDAGKISRLVAEGRDVLPMSPDDLLPSPVMMRNPACEEFHGKGDAEGLISTCVSEENPDTLMYAASAYRMLGYFDQAENALEKALSLAEKRKDIRRTALCLSMMGDLYLFRDDFGTSGKLLEQAIGTARKSEDGAVIASILNNIGNYFAAQGSRSEAADIYRESLEILENLSEPQNELKSAVLLNLARVSAKTESPYQKYENILKLILNLPDSHTKAWNLLAFSRIADDSLKNRALTEAVRISENLNDVRTASYSFGYSGMAYLNQKKYAEAADMTRQAVFRAQQGYFPEILYHWQWQSGKIFNATGKTEEAILAYRNAVETLNPVRRDDKPCAAGIMQEVFRSGFRRRQVYDSSIRPVYTELTEILLSSAKSAEDETRRQNLLKQAEGGIELLKTTDLKNYFQDECLAEKQAKKGQKNAFAPLPDTAIIYPILSDRQPGMLMRFSDGLEYADIPMDTETIRVKLRILAGYFRKSLLIGDASIKSLTTQLYRWFIEPIEPELIRRNIGTLVIVPDGELWSVPFAAFYDGKQFLIEKYALAVLPAVGFTEFDKSGKDEESALMAGLSVEQEDFDALPNVEKELLNIKSVMGGTLLLNQEYTAVSLEAEFRHREYADLVLSTHGVFGGSPQETYLLAYGGRLTMNDLERLIGLGQFRENPLDLLTLSACETALGDERAMLGLGGIAVKAGAKTALATLWKVSDDSTSVLTGEFYRQLKTRKVPKAQALRHAQMKLISDSRYEHPFFWAPFLLIGNWM